MGPMKIASLFSGCGGTDLGFKGGFEYLGVRYKRHPVKTIYANEIDEKIADIFEKNNKLIVERSDIRKVSAKSIEDHEILIGGFPCVNFSIIAQNPPRLGIKGADGTLYAEMCRILRVKKPLCFLAENVKGILSSNKSKAFPIIMREFRKCGYYVIHILLNANHFGVPQKRERVFIIGFKKAEHMDRFRPPMPVDYKNVLHHILMPEFEVHDKYYFSKKAISGLKKANKKMNKGRVQNINMPCNTVGSHLAKVSINSTDPVLKINGKYRRFTPREVARIQSFPEKFELPGTDFYQYKALGNAIPPVLAWYVADSIIRAIKE